MDGDFTYNPSTGNLTATKFTGSGVALTGVVTSIVAGSNISLAGGPTGIVTISSSGGGGLSLSNGTNNNVVTASSATALNGEGNLTFDGTTLALTGNQTASGSIVVGSGVTINSDGINAVGKGVTAGTFNALSGSFNVQIGALNQGFYLNNGSTTWLGLSWSGSASIYQFRGNSGGNYPIVVDDFSSISLSPKSGAVNLNFAENNKLSTTSGGISVTGIATATGFSGPLTGDVTGTASTATNVTLGNDSSGSTPRRLIFASADTGNVSIQADTSDGATYTPSNGRISAGSFATISGTSSQFLKADGSVDSNTYLTSGSYLENVVEDTTPQLGGDLDLNSKNITGTGNAEIVGVITATSAVKTWTLGASGADHYTFTGDGFTSATNDPDIYLERGKRYAFLNNSGGTHPFQIRLSNGGSAYTTGVTYHIEHSSGSNSASQGYITFNVPWDAPASLYYQCTAHSSMGGNIYIRGAGGHNTNVGLTTFSSNVILDSGDITVSHSGLAVNIFESTDNHSRFRIRSADASQSQLEFADQTDADAGEIRYSHDTDRMTFHVYENTERVGITSTGNVQVNSGVLQRRYESSGTAGYRYYTKAERALVPHGGSGLNFTITGMNQGFASLRFGGYSEGNRVNFRSDIGGYNAGDVGVRFYEANEITNQASNYGSSTCSITVTKNNASYVVNVTQTNPSSNNMAVFYYFETGGYNSVSTLTVS